MTVTAAQVKELRELTGAGMMDAKKALVESDGDLEKAKEYLRQKGLSTAEKKSGRTAADGQVAARVSDDRKLGVLVEVNCETDFVARGDQFQSFVSEVTEQITEGNPRDVDDLLTQESRHAPGKTVQDYLTDKIATIKENIRIRRFVRYERSAPGAVNAYIHTGGKIGVLVEFETGNDATAGNEAFQQLMKDVAMQIASFSAEFVTRDDIPKDVIEQERRIEMGKEDLANKPEEIRAKIVEGRVNKLLGQRVLVEQEFVKDPSKTVGRLMEEQGNALGDAGVKVVRFSRYALGEGIEKEESNFAEEVAAATKG